MATIWFTSDVHARIDLLKEMVEYHVAFERGDMLICLGDYVDNDSNQENAQSWEALNYLYHLHRQYPKQCIVLCGNHDNWLGQFLAPKSFPSLHITLLPELETLQDFLTNDEFMPIFTEARAKSRETSELLNALYHGCRSLIRNKHSKLIKWLSELPLYYEHDDFIAVHAGIKESKKSREHWKSISDANTFLMKYPAEKGKFFKPIIAGHISTAQITAEPTFHDICRFGNHIYVDSCVQKSDRLNLLKYDTQTKTFTGVKKELDNWVAYPVIKKV